MFTRTAERVGVPTVDLTVHFRSALPLPDARPEDFVLCRFHSRVAAEGWPTPYLHDSTQEVAHAFGAKVTPDVFVFDARGRLRYRGAPDADYQDPSQRAGWLRAALDSVLTGDAPEQAETKPIGCSIKWKQ